MTANADRGAWSERDLQAIAAQGMTVGEVERQLATFRQGVTPVRLIRPGRVGDGIIVIPEQEKKNLLAGYEEACRTRRIMEFVPASGAASRMFREWFRCIDEGGFADDLERAAFVADLKRYAFFGDLQSVMAARNHDIDLLLANREEANVLRFILTEQGLNYGLLPKALLKFHAYPGESRTALEEHLVEAALYARDAANVSRIHLTVSREHEAPVRTFLSRLIPIYESLLSTRFEVGLSTQNPATDTIAVDTQIRPFRNAEGGLIFRPGGHGSLIDNLNLLDEDLIFIKNIDNTVPDRLKGEMVFWKKLLAGFMIRLQEGIFSRLRLLEEGGGTEEELKRVCDFAQSEVNIDIPPLFRGLSRTEQRSLLFKRLNRPLRVCGVVRNEGEPGGAPFWVEGSEEGASLEIIEESQINRDDSKQLAIWSSATHFNPVDIVCGVRDYRGKKFDLDAFVDPTQAAITLKSEKGREILALERPGLWNGSMAFWNTILIEVPVSTFNPVKTVADLLRPQHLPG
jgi:hypothetical protein